MKDLREFISACRAINEVQDLEGVAWDEEIGALTEAVAELPYPPLIVFDAIQGYPRGSRVVSLAIATYRRVALALGLPPDQEKLQLLRLASKKMNHAMQAPIPPAYVSNAPIMANVLEAAAVDVTRFPVPRYHASDGGRYIGTGDSLINKDPESGYVNMGTYRMQLHGPKLLGLWMSPGQQGRQICQRYWDRGESCPVAATFGGDPLTFMASHTQLPWGTCELDVAGGLHGQPVEVVRGPLTGLPIPAHAEIAIEGEAPPPGVQARDEGPFGEWPGYYSGGTRGTGEAQPVICIKAVYFRDDPILMNMAPMWPGAPILGMDLKAALLWDQLETAGIQDVTGVWIHERYFAVVAIRQRYAGHAKQVGAAVLSCSAIARNGRFVVVVDDDIDPSNIKEVLWAMETRVDPATDIDLVDGCWSTPLDPRMPPNKRQTQDFTNSRGIFYAVRPFAWRDKFPQVSRSPREVRRKVVDKYRDVFDFPAL